MLNLVVELGIVLVTALFAYAVMHYTLGSPQRLAVLLLYFSFTFFVSATLLMGVQPMIGKLVLPQLGGTPAVWNTCMVFFQGTLLIGYGYAHVLTTTQPPRRQVIIQCAMVLFPLLVLPFTLGAPPDDSEGNPVFWLMGKLVILAGLPYFAVSATAPLLQKWFAHTGHPAAKDPYFLYGASNLGSMLGLGLYPTVLEPWLQVAPGENENTIHTQVHLWEAGFAVFVGLMMGCAFYVWRGLNTKTESSAPAREQPAADAARPAEPVPAATAITSAPRRRGARLDSSAPAKAAAPERSPIPDEPIPDDNITMWRRLRWIGLAAAPSSLMLGVTTYMTTDIAAVAFFWIIPLMLYLLTFILVFARWPVIWTRMGVSKLMTPHIVVLFLQPMLLLFLVLKMTANLSPPTWLEFTLHVGSFFGIAMMCHGELARDRPSPRHLTEFFFLMSFGGVLGGLFNAFFAPIYFQYGIWEYPIAMAFACLLRPNLVDDVKTLIPGDSSDNRPTPLGYILDWAAPVLIGVGCYFLVYIADNHGDKFFLFKRSYLLACAVVLTLALSLRPVRFGMSVAALFLAVGIYDRYHDSLLYEGRGFFGLLRVRESKGDWYGMPGKKQDEDGAYEWKIYRTLIHGGINHGRQITGFKVLDDRNNEVLTEKELQQRGRLTDAELQRRRDLNLTGRQINGFIPWDDRKNEDLTLEELQQRGTLTAEELQRRRDLNLKLTLLKRREPITYFHERNGVAEVYNKASWPDARLPASMVGFGASGMPMYDLLTNTQSEPPYAVLGLGTGILGCYAKPYQTCHFYEIDPLVRNLSFPPDGKEPVFWFLKDAKDRGADIKVIMGDGRLRLKAAPEKYYHIISLDAFSSDAIPVHLLTAEAIELYMSKLVDGGVLVFNTTNRYVRIEGVLSAIAKKKGYDCLHCPDYTYDTDHPDRYSADWVVLARKIDGLEPGMTPGEVEAIVGKPVGTPRQNGNELQGYYLYPGAKNADSKQSVHASPEKPAGIFVTFATKEADQKKSYSLVRATYANGGPLITDRLEKTRKRTYWFGRQVYNNKDEEIIDDRWQEVAPLEGPIWTDAYSNLLKVMRWDLPPNTYYWFVRIGGVLAAIAVILLVIAVARLRGK